MRRVLRVASSLLLLASCSESNAARDADSGAGGALQSADASAGSGGSANPTGGSAGSGAGGSSSSTGGSSSGTGGSSSGTGGTGAVATMDSGTGCNDTGCLCAAFANCDPVEVSRSTGQDGLLVDRICGLVDGECAVVSYIRYTESAIVSRCSFPLDAPCDSEGGGLQATASPYCVREYCSASGTPCTDDFFLCR